jgi:DNA repair ATPase RecN
MAQASEHEAPLHVVALTAENVKRIRAITVRPEGPVVIIGGRNAQGKSSLLDALEMALGGGRSIPLEPVRHGARKARIVADLGELVVERTFTAKGTELVVRGKDGETKASPQKLLDSLCAKVTFDPFAFSRMEPKEQDALLKKLLGLDFSDLERAREKVYGQRTDANREVKRLEALLDSMPDAAGAPAEPVDVAELSAEIQRRMSANGDRERQAARLNAEREQLTRWDREIEDLTKKLEQRREDRDKLHAAIIEGEHAIPPVEDVAELDQKLKGAEATNAKVRAAAERKRLGQELKKHETAAEGFSETIASIDGEKAERLAAAKFPIPGLGFDDSGPTLDDVPLSQASSAQKLRVSVAIGAALNPRVKIMLVREGSLLDEESMRLLAELARETDSQVWIERVGSGDASAVIIEDGAVLDASGEAAAE